MNSRPRTPNTETVIVTAVAFTLLLRVLLGAPVFGLAAVALAALGVLTGFPKSITLGFNKNPTITLGLMLITPVALLNTEAFNGRPLFYALLGFCHLWLAWVLTRRLDFAVSLSRVLLISFYSFFIIQGIRLGFSPEAINSYISGGSRNLVGFIAIAFQVLYSIALYRGRGRYALITPLLTFVLCYLSYGRSGIAISLSIAIASIWFWVWARSFFWALCIAISLTAVAFGLADLYQDTIIALAKRSSFNRFGLQSVRFEMLIGYLESIDPGALLIGYDFHLIEAIADHNNNPHNSFIRGHAYFGLPFLLMIGWMVLRAAIAAPHQPFLASLFFLLLARVAIDSVAFFESFDYVLFFAWLAIIKPTQAGVARKGDQPVEKNPKYTPSVSVPKRSE